MGHSIEELNSDKALVARSRKFTEAWAGTIWFVIMADGYGIECGDGPSGERRAIFIAEKINT